ncbi:MAG: beta/gamma crystallin family protein, partial [Rhizobacter sp.]|nr:beta/gamma crystallin family protein [Rhizobacter sp.]
MSTTTRRLVGLAAIAFAAHASAQVTFYEGEGFRGRTFQANNKIWNLDRFGFNDRASSAVVERGRWEVCDDSGFRGHCVVLRHGSYDSLRAMGLDNRISSVRPVDERHAYRAEESAPAPVPAPVPAYEWRRRPNERLVEVPVTSVRAVMGSAEQRCWIEHQPAGQTQIGGHDVNVPGAVVGGVLGGILGHQIGGGMGNALATVGGVAGGAALGSNVGSQ